MRSTRHHLAGAVAEAIRHATLRFGCHPTLGEVAEVKGFTCVDAGLGVSPANVALPRSEEAATLARLRDVASWFASRGLNFRVDVPADAPSELMGAAMTLGLRFLERQPVMLLERDWPQPRLGKLDVRPAASPASLDAFSTLDALEYGNEPLLAGIVQPASEDPRVLLFLGFFEGQPVARIAAMVHGSLGTLHSLYVQPAVRGRGFGSEMTLAALAAARARGAEAAALMSTPTAASLYRRLGFETIGEIVVMGCEAPLL